jgi:hypothetical protein
VPCVYVQPSLPGTDWPERTGEVGETHLMQTRAGEIAKLKNVVQYQGSKISYC